MVPGRTSADAVLPCFVFDKRPIPSAQFQAIYAVWGTQSHPASLLSWQRQGYKSGSRIEICPSTLAASLQMTLTVAHITPIMSLVAGVLILLMPRLLNFIVAIFLVLNGLIGLGLLKWLHL